MSKSSINILLLGSGGREHALAWKLAQSDSCGALWVTPGNPGIRQVLEEHNLKRDRSGEVGAQGLCFQTDISNHEGLVDFCQTYDIGLVVIGPEAPLVDGLADALREADIPVFGPSAAAAMLEGSKGFTKDLCLAEGIPTARFVRVEETEASLAALDGFGIPVVIKADGLAAGKGVTVAMTRDEAEEAIRAANGGPLVIEEFLEGEEASLFALVDGGKAIPLASAQDHKRVGEGDTGPNTGGMGAYSPAPVLTPELEARAMAEIVTPTALAMARAGTPFSGLLYAGLMLTAEGPKLIEYNVRFGDPECEAIVPRLKGDLAQLLLSVAEGRLGEVRPELSDQHSMTVILAAEGYPGTPRKGGTIDGIEAAERVAGVTVFHAGTARHGSGALLSAGGRVLAVTALGDTLAEAKARAYRGVDAIDFADGFHRRDIGWRELGRQS